jgi:tight adherence protein B
VGLTGPETAFFLLGAALVAHFLLRTALPWAHVRFFSATNRHSDELREEFLHLPPSRIAFALLLSGTSCGIVVLLASGSFAAAVASGSAPALFAGAVVRRYRVRRKKRIIAQIPVLLDLLAGHMKAGHSLAGSLSEIVALLPSGIREEMAWLLQQLRLGVSPVEAFTLWEKRIAGEEVSLLVKPLRAAIPGGGNVVDLLERTRDILRLRHRADEKLRSMTAQARLQAVVLTMLGPVFAAVLSRIDPGFFPKLVGTAQGKALLLLSGTLQVLGWVAIRKILAVRP